MKAEVTWNAKNPSNQRTIRTAAIIASMLSSFFLRARTSAISFFRTALMPLCVRENLYRQQNSHRECGCLCHCEQSGIVKASISSRRSSSRMSSTALTKSASMTSGPKRNLPKGSTNPAKSTALPKIPNWSRNIRNTSSAACKKFVASAAIPNRHANPITAGISSGVNLQ
jgi:hypothetical protein